MIGTGYECTEKDVDTVEDNSLVIPGTSTSNSFQRSQQDIRDLSEEEGSGNDEE